MIKFDRIKISILALILLFISESCFRALSSKWYEEIPQDDERPSIFRKRVLSAITICLLLFICVVMFQIVHFKYQPTLKYYLQILAVYIALVSSLCRGGWDIQSYKGETVVERVDRGLFAISQVGATMILLFILIF